LPTDQTHPERAWFRVVHRAFFAVFRIALSGNRSQGLNQMQRPAVL